MNRAYSLLTVKEFNEEDRTLEGVATTPTPDSYGDIVDPKGADFSLPMPFLWQHRHDQPIGHVVEATATDEGIKVKIQLVKTDEAGGLKERLDEAWQSIKLGLVKGLSIGFKPVEYARLDDTGGLHFLKWIWHELSAVTIPANAEGQISMIKSLDAEHLPNDEPTDDKPPAASGKQARVVKLNAPARAREPFVLKTITRGNDNAE